MNKIVIAALLSFSSMVYAVKPAIDSDKFYFTQEELLCTYFDSFFIHIGENVWEKTGTIYRDSGGMYYYEDRNSRQWRCPYCLMFFKIGTACKNEECPSQY